MNETEKRAAERQKKTQQEELDKRDEQSCNCASKSGALFTSGKIASYGPTYEKLRQTHTE